MSAPTTTHAERATRLPGRLLATAGVLVTLAAGAVGFTPRHDVPSPLMGTWTLVAADRIGADGVRRKDYGETPSGRLLVDASGRYSALIVSSERPRFASGDKSKGTPEEYAAATLGMSAHFGAVSVDAATGTLRFRIERSAFKNWEGTEQVRSYVLTGDELSYQVPASASGNGSTAISVWRLVR